MTDFNLDTACREAQNRLHRSIGQLARQAKVRCLRNIYPQFSREVVPAELILDDLKNLWIAHARK